MSREVKSITLTLENCEQFEVERKHIGELHVGGIERRIGRSACNSISEDFFAKEFHIQINKNANIVNGDTSMFKRIKAYNDVTQIYIEYDNDTSELLFVKWGGESDQINELQTTAISEINGDLFVVIDENSNVEKEFEHLIEEDDNFTWEMYEE